jgi:hypothetical protein
LPLPLPLPLPFFIPPPAEVDMAFWAHEHSYERTWPVYNNTVHNGTTHPGDPYRNAGATVHIVTGSAGCREGHGHYDKGARGAWSAVRNTEYGYGKLRVANATHLQATSPRMRFG